MLRTVSFGNVRKALARAPWRNPASPVSSPNHAGPGILWIALVFRNQSSYTEFNPWINLSASSRSSPVNRSPRAVVAARNSEYAEPILAFATFGAYATYALEKSSNV